MEPFIEVMASRISRVCLSLFFITAGALHFIRGPFYLKIMPPFIPYPLAMVYVSGFLEIFFGVLVFFRGTRRWSAWGLVLLLTAVFPVNIYMALHAGIFPAFPAWIYWARLPLQGVFIWWVLKCASA